MTDAAPKFIGKRIQVQKFKYEIRISISQQVERWQEAMLIAWLSGWTFCGMVFIGYAVESQDFSERMFFIILSSVWFFFFIRIGKVLMWRKMGRELISITPEGLALKNAMGKRGKAEVFKLDSILKLGIIKHEDTNFLSFLDQSFWVIGGDRVGFNHGNAKIRLGKQLSIKDAELLVRTMDSAIREFKKQGNAG